MNEFYDDDDEFLLHFLLSKIFSKIQVVLFEGLQMTRASYYGHPSSSSTRNAFKISPKRLKAFESKADLFSSSPWST